MMSKHVSISPEEAADRLAIRELVEAYAPCADHRDAKGQMALFSEDTHFVVYMDAKDPKPRRLLTSTNLGLGEVAFLLGFEEVNSFMRAFHVWEGTTPVKWRARGDSHHDVRPAAISFETQPPGQDLIDA